jgi:RNA polymerase sigma-70 factor, ECF subfamily
MIRETDFTLDTDDELLLRMRRGDEEAFLALYRRRQGPIYRFALHMTGSSATAEDVTQEVFLAVIREDCGFDPLKGTLSGYLYGIARKLALRHLERSRSASEQGLDLENWAPELALSADPIIDLLRREGIAELRKAVFALPQRYREVVLLCDLEEMDYAEAAALLDCPIGTVRSRLHRARALLLEKLKLKREPQNEVGGLNPARSLI